MKPMTPDELEELLAGVNDFDAYNKCFLEYEKLYTQHQAVVEALKQIDKEVLAIVSCVGLLKHIGRDIQRVVQAALAHAAEE